MRMYLQLIVAVAALAAAPLLFPDAPVGGLFALPFIVGVFLEEQRHSLTEAARQVNVSPSTVWRWAMHGVRGVKLETQVWGAKRFVTESALEQFRADCTAAANGEQPQVRTPKQRSRDADRADKELADQGA